MSIKYVKYNTHTVFVHDYKRDFHGDTILGGFKANLVAEITDVAVSYMKHNVLSVQLTYVVKEVTYIKVIALVHGNEPRIARNIYESVYEALPAHVPDEVKVSFPKRRFTATTVKFKGMLTDKNGIVKLCRTY